MYLWGGGSAITGALCRIVCAVVTIAIFVIIDNTAQERDISRTAYTLKHHTFKVLKSTALIFLGWNLAV